MFHGERLSGETTGVGTLLLLLVVPAALLRSSSCGLRAGPGLPAGQLLPRQLLLSGSQVGLEEGAEQEGEVGGRMVP